MLDFSDSEEEDTVGEISTPVSPSKVSLSPIKRKTILRSTRKLCKQPSTSGMIYKISVNRFIFNF